MVEDMKNKGYGFEDYPYFVLTFHTLIGSLYKRGGIAFYGRATNGWDDDYNNGISSILTHSHSRFFQMIKQPNRKMLCKVTTNRTMSANGVKVEKGMSVEVISRTNNFNNSNDRVAMRQAFIRKYGLDVTKAMPSLTFFQIEVLSR